MGFARVPNGTGPFIIQHRTFAANNSPSSNTTLGQVDWAKLYPTLANDVLNVDLSIAEGGQLNVYDALGKKILEQTLPSAINRPNIGAWPQGIYWAHFFAGGMTSVQKLIVIHKN